jgi:hypothetical protein
MQLGTGINDRYKRITFWKDAIDELMVKVFLESHDQAPEEIILDMDTTDRYTTQGKTGTSTRSRSFCVVIPVPFRPNTYGQPELYWTQDFRIWRLKMCCFVSRD